MVDLLTGTQPGNGVGHRLRGCEIHVPAHFDAEVLSALGRLHRSGLLAVNQVEARIERAAEIPASRHPLGPLMVGAWRRRHNLRLVDALYVELGESMGAPLITTDRGLAAAAGAELIE